MQMNPEQITQLLRLLERIADRQFTITQAADWPMVYVVLAMTISVFVAGVGFFWRDVSKRFDALVNMMNKLEINDCKEHDKIWRAMADCQKDCCPPRVNRMK